MINTIQGNNEVADHRLQETLMLCSKLIIESQENMLCRIEAMLGKLVESQIHKKETSNTCIEQGNVNNTIAATDKLAAEVVNMPPPPAASSDEEIIQVSDLTESTIFEFRQQLQVSDFTGLLTTTVNELRSEEDDQEIDYILDGYEALWVAAEEGNWLHASEFLKNNPAAITESITTDSETALHIAMYKSRWVFVKEIVKLMPKESLELQESVNGFTALHIAAMLGDTKAAEVLVTKNPKLTQIRDNTRSVPLQIAATMVSDGQKEVLDYLYSVTRDEDPSPFSGHDGAGLLCNALDANFYDLALSLVQRFPKLVTEKAKISKLCGLEVMIQRPFVFFSGAKLSWFQRHIYSIIPVDMDSPFNRGTKPDEENPLGSTEEPATGYEGIITRFISTYLMPCLTRVPSVKQLHNQKLMHKQASALVKCMLAQLDETMNTSEITDFFSNSCVMKTAIKYGTVEFVEEGLRYFPYLIWQTFGSQMMIQMAIGERNEEILSLIFETCRDEAKNELVSRLDDSNNSILHYAAMLAPCARLNLVSGAALKMQREIQWFKGVEKIALEKDKLNRNKDGNTAQFIFTEEHRDLLEKGEKWMKDTSGSCMLVAALITTVAFAAAFTVPGGNISDTDSINNGTPIFLHKKAFTVFAVADSLSLFSSITSILMFLAIYTSRYAEEDFLKSLPQKMIIGLASLFISMATIMVAFGAALTLVVGHRFAWAPIPIVLFGCITVALFALLQLPLFVDMVRSTYWPRVFRKQSLRIMKPDNKKKKEN